MALTAGQAHASCSPSLSPTTTFYGASAASTDTCAIRYDSDGSGTYLVTCENGTSGSVSGTVYTSRFDLNHNLLGAISAANTGYTSRPQVPDAVSLINGGAELWFLKWHGHYNYDPYEMPIFRRFSDAMSPLGYENEMFDQTSAAYYSRWSHAVDVLPTTERVVNVDSVLHWVGPNSCYGGSHIEWRTSLQLRSPDGSQVYGSNLSLASAGCSYDGYHQGTPGWGQEDPDVAAYWYTGGDRFVAVWHERGNGQGIVARVFDANGVGLTGDIIVDADAGAANAETVLSPRVHALSSGFIVTWVRADQTLWMRPYNANGVPFSGKLQVASSTSPKTLAVDISGTTFAPCPGYRPSSYFAITWWDLTPSGSYDYAYPHWRLFQGLNPPVAIGGDRTIDSQPYIRDPSNPDQGVPPWARASVSFEPGCSDSLNVGFAYWLRDYRYAYYNQARRALQRQFFRCPTTAASGASAAQESLLSAASSVPEDASGLSCAKGECWADVTQASPDEPPVLFPED